MANWKLLAFAGTARAHSTTWTHPKDLKDLKDDAPCRGTAAWDALVRDTRHGLRRLAHDWRFTAAAVLILGLGIGVTTAMFSLVNAVLFRDQALPNPDRIVNIYQNDREGRPVATSYAAYLEMAEYKDVFDSVVATSVPDGVRYLDAGAVHNGVVEFTTPSYLDVLGLQPSIGRWFDASEDTPNAAAGRGARASDLDQAVSRRSRGRSAARSGSRACR